MNIKRSACTILCWLIAFSAMAQDENLIKARNLFYQSIEHEKSIDEAIALFQSIYDSSEIYRGRALTYIGTLYTLRGKHAFWPYNKLKWVSKGLKVMDEGIALNPDDMESLFIFGSTCHYLPSFFKRNEDAEKSFNRIIELLPGQYQQHQPAMILNMIDFLENHAKLDDKEQRTLQNVKGELTQK